MACDGRQGRLGGGRLFVHLPNSPQGHRALSLMWGYRIHGPLNERLGDQFQGTELKLVERKELQKRLGASRGSCQGGLPIEGRCTTGTLPLSMRILTAAAEPHQNGHLSTALDHVPPPRLTRLDPSNDRRRARDHGVS